MKDITISEGQYLKLFSKADVPLPNLKKVAAYIFSIPCSNTHTKRVFSMMTTAWRDERNRLKAELQICINFTEECTAMYSCPKGNSWRQLTQV